MMLWRRLVFVAALLFGAMAPARAEGPACGALPEALEAGPLPGTAAALGRKNVRVMIVGSASTQGGGTSGPAATWPERLARLLQARYPDATFEFRTYGGRGTTAADHARLLEEHGPGFRPHLVIWQVGTVEAARGLPAAEMGEIIKDTAARIRAARGERTDVVLMDPQFSRFLRANADVDRYREKLQMASAASGAQLFSRWDIMKNWSESERLDMERAPRELRTRIADELHDCLARALVVFVGSGTEAAARR
jgi:signal transduction histidine kinase